MRIAFINSCLELGRDGVGDYTRSLAQECVRQGHKCCLVALNDYHVSEPTKVSCGDDLQQLRLPTTMSWPKRIQVAQEMLNAFAPDWISLQFVPYAFHPKGFVHGLGRRLRPLLARRQVHIMFHELWIGEPTDSSLQHRLVGAIQKRLILQLTRQLKPITIHTSNDIYTSILAREGITARRLPLFGNVPVEEKTGNDWLFAELRKADVEISASNREKFWLTGFFGALPPHWSPEPVLTTLLQAADRNSRRLVILSIGEIVSGEPLWQELMQRYSLKIKFLKFGRQPAEKVSQFLNSLDFGLAATAYGRIGKSGAVAAMLDHGLPVIVSQDEEFRTVLASKDRNEPLLYRLDHLPKRLDAGLERQAACARLPEIAAHFIQDLQKPLFCIKPQ